MNRRVVVVLVCTVVALFAATLSVPVESNVGTLGGPIVRNRGRIWIWTLRVPRYIQWSVYGLQLGTPVVLGGLLALVLHLRARRVAGDRS